MSPRRALVAVRGHPSAAVLALQLFAVLAYPFLDDNVAGQSVLGLLQVGVVVAAVAAVRNTPTLSWVALVFGAPGAVFSVLEAVTDEADWAVLGSAAFHVPFYLFVSYAMIRYLFHDDRVTRDELFATGAAFTVVAWAFTYVYAAAQVVWPGSFISNAGEGQREWFELLYLSFTTLTSVGLSDVVPVRDHARSLVMIEQVAGVFYVALVVARLVGLSARRPSPGDGA
ncbi:potassium channel family protein [Nocardioides litoris]|uniref:potassium channel family protein n=1 Tax=Nocardioides litoris TaxID=1926648 RepID=UPI00111F45D7|nr:potassium channel family protein [Nocardioides litoris]